MSQLDPQSTVPTWKTGMKNQPNQRSDSGTRIGLALIVAGVAVWGIFHAVGTYVADSTPDWRKPVVVLACSFSFLAFWGWLLYWRGRRK